MKNLFTLILTFLSFFSFANGSFPKNELIDVCPVTGVISNKPGSPTSICNDGTTTTQIQVVLSGSASLPPVYEFYIKTPSGGTITKAVAASVTGNTYIYNVKEAGNYTFISVSDQTCIGTGTGTATVTVNLLPTASLGTGLMLCKEDDKTLPITLTGTAPYTVEYNSPGGVKTTTTGSIPVPPIESGTYTIVKVIDANNCINTTFSTQSATVIRYPDLITSNASASCDFNSQTATIKFNVSGGIPPYVFSMISGTFSSPTYTVNFPADETKQYDIRVSDRSGCANNVNVRATAGVINCSPLLAIKEDHYLGNVTISPNPSESGVFSINSNTNSEMKVFDTFGNQVAVVLIQEGQSTLLDISKNPRGVYFIQSQNNSGKTITRIVY